MRIDMLGARSFPATHGGLEVACEKLSLRLAQEGHSVRVIVDGSKKCTTDGVAVHGVPTVRTKHLHALSQTLGSVVVTARGRPDIAHFHGVGPAIFGGVPRARHIPTVATVQGIDWRRDKWTRTSQRLFERAAVRPLRRANEVISVSKAIQKLLMRDYGIDSTYIPNGVDLPTPASDDSILSELRIAPKSYILFAARIVPEKGLHFLLEAYRQLKPGIPLVVAGGGSASYSDAYEAECRSQAPDGVIFAGFRSGEALNCLLENARTYVLPSVLEGLPLGLLEAMSHRLPVIHSDIDECTEVTRGDAGISFRARDVTDLRRALKTVLEDEGTCRQLGANAVARVQQEYNWEGICAETVKVYERVVAANGDRR
jgi:glycosyltransferase involved in cell wall biosynthesis